MQDEKIRSFEGQDVNKQMSGSEQRNQIRDLSMADVTVKHLAEMVGIPVESLLQKMKEVGLGKSDSGDSVSDDERRRLLDFLNDSKTDLTAAPKKQITLKRKSVSTLKLSGVGGKSKTVNVEVRKKRTFLKKPEDQERSHVDEQPDVDQSSVEELETKQHVVAGEPASPETSESPVSEAAAVVDPDVDVQAEPEFETQAQEIEISSDALPSKAKRHAAVSSKKSKKAIASVQISSKTKDVKVASVSSSADHAEVTKRQAKPEDSKARQEADEKARQKTLEEARKIAEDLAQREIKGEVAPATVSDDDLGVEDAIVKQALEESFAEEERRVKRARRDKEKASSKNEREKERKLSQPQNKPRKIRLKGTGEHGFQSPTVPVTRDVKIGENITVADVANQMSIKGSVVVKELFKMGVMANINQSIDQETAVLLVEELGHQPVIVSGNAIEEDFEAMFTGNVTYERKQRPPVVTIMGHVDHGKTSLLDYIRRTKIADSEAGGITQHIGAYHVTTEKGVITFLDTPGHAAFTAMRARGAQATDIVILVVAADDGVKPQTEEAIQHARAAGVPLIVALNKIDKEGIDLDRVRNELSVCQVISEEWGGDTQFVPLSAHTGEGVDELLDAVLLQSEVLELTAPDTGPSKGVVIESRLDKGRGVVTSLLVQEGILQIGDTILAGEHIGRVRAMHNETGRLVDLAGPSIPVEVLGLSSVPEAGEVFVTVPDEKKAREVAEFRKVRARETRFARAQAAKLENIFEHLKAEEMAAVNLIIKADVRGSMEAIIGALKDLSTDEVCVSVISSGVGGITETDANLAVTSGATIIGFNTRADATARHLCEAEGVDIRYYSVIYDIIDDVKKAMSGLLQPERREEILGVAEVRDVFRSSKFGTAAGCMVIEGVIHRNKPIRVLRDDVVIFKGELESLRRFKDDASEVRQGLECGVAVKSYNDVKVGDKIEVFDVKIISRTLD